MNKYTVLMTIFLTAITAFGGGAIIALDIAQDLMSDEKIFEFWKSFFGV